MGNLSDYAHFEELKHAFLTGYRTARPLPADLEAHLPVLMAARHASQCLCAASLAHRPGTQELDTVDHIAEARRCLTFKAGKCSEPLDFNSVASNSKGAIEDSPGSPLIIFLCENIDPTHNRSDHGRLQF